MLVRRVDGSRRADPAVELAERPDDAWWRLALGREPDRRDERWVLDPRRARCARRSAGHGVRAGRRRGRVRAAVVDDHLHLSLLAVAPTARRAGVWHRADGRGRAAWGREHGARWAVLQVALHNTAARAFYDALGATEHHRYRYLVPPARDAVAT